MPTRDIRSNLLPKLALNANITTSTTTSGSIIDTADYDLGVMFQLACIAYTDGTYTPNILMSDDSGMAGAVSVPAANLIGTYAGAVLNALTAGGATLKTLGVVGTLRYLQFQIVSTSVTSGARIVVENVNKPEILPTVDTLGA
jgi:hypothetical protein